MASLLSSVNKLDEIGKASLLDYLDFLLKKQDPAVEDVKPAGKHGRPRKVQVEITDIAAEPKAKAVRGRKKAEAIKVEATLEPKRGRGRPKKTVDAEVVIESPVKGKRGRPKKVAVEAGVISVYPMIPLSGKGISKPLPESKSIRGNWNV